jgi:hypothetical protein
MKDIIIKLGLAVVIIVLGYMIYASLMKPIHFNEARSQREVEVIQRLKDIRTAQSFFKQANSRYTKSFDSLINFIQRYEIPVVKLIPDPSDTTFTKTIADTLGYVKVSDSLFSKRKSFNVNDLRFVPHSNGKIIELNAGSIDRGGVKVSVFEAKIPFKDYLAGLEEQRINNLAASREDINKFGGLKVGSMDEPSTDGNWE